MRMLLAVVVLISPAIAGAQVVRPDDAAARPTRPLEEPPSAARGKWCEDDATPARRSTCDIYAHRARSLTRLRDRLIAATAVEGGTLSEASRGRYQAELDLINARFQRQLRNATLFSVDSTGRSTIG